MEGLFRNDFMVEWVGLGETNSPGGEPLLRFNSYARIDGSWTPIQEGSVLTQVRENEDPEIRTALLEKLADRIEPLVQTAIKKKRWASFSCNVDIPGADEVFEKMAWFGPEFAEEY
jgi:hypothetical protein